MQKPAQRSSEMTHDVAYGTGRHSLTQTWKNTRKNTPISYWRPKRYALHRLRPTVQHTLFYSASTSTI